MIMLRMLFECVGLIAASLVAAVLLCWLAWTAFKLIRHPEWGPPAVLVLIVFAFGDSIRTSEFLRMLLLFTALAAALLWAEGRAWRMRHTNHKMPGRPAADRHA